jgi:hypothetical protein
MSGGLVCIAKKRDQTKPKKKLQCINSKIENKKKNIKKRFIDIQTDLS